MHRILPAVFAAAIIAVAPIRLFGETPRMAVSVDFGPTIQTLVNTGGFGIGAAFEYAFLESFSLVPQFTYAVTGKGEAVTNNFIPGLQLRLYPFSYAVRDFWVAAGFNYALVTGAGITGTTAIPAVIVDVGFKLVLPPGNESGFFVEPYAGYGLAFTPTIVRGNYDYGVFVGLCF